MTERRVARTVVEAIRLDRWDAAEVLARVDHGVEVGVGGFVLFGGQAGVVARVAERARAAAGRDLWVAADLERGAGQQFRGLCELPPPAALARHADPVAATRLAAELTAREALSVGVNWVLAPVLDLDVERENPIVATRSFGADSTMVGTLGRHWIEACQDAGALACGKHFPGHGRTLADSHIELPVVAASREELELDLAPFRAVAEVTGSMMVAHVAYPSVGVDRAATVSREIVTGLLRDELRFDGLVATDAMIMAGVGDDDAVAAVAAMRAGCDVVLYPGDLERTVEALDEAAGSDEEFARRIDQAIVRSERALARFPSSPSREAAGSETLPGAAIDLAGQVISSTAGALEGWRSAVETEVVALADDPEIGPPAGREGPLGAILVATLLEAGWAVRRRVIDAESDRSADPRHRSAQRIVVLAATPRGWKGHGGPSPAVVARVRTELAAADAGVLVLLGHRRWLDDLAVPGICAWSTETVMERAAAVWIDRRVRGESPS
ncbi:MAG: glycoside hydrolase family 3 N-terminal domain-containing protein [Gemmatimonadota bacterium]